MYQLVLDFSRMMTPVEQHFVIEKPNANIFQLWQPTEITANLGFPKRYSTFLYLKRLISYRPKKSCDPTGIWTRTCQRQRFSLCKMLLERSHHSRKVKYSGLSIKCVGWNKHVGWKFFEDQIKVLDGISMLVGKCLDNHWA